MARFRAPYVILLRELPSLLRIVSSRRALNAKRSATGSHLMAWLEPDEGVQAGGHVLRDHAGVGTRYDSVRTLELISASYSPFTIYARGNTATMSFIIHFKDEGADSLASVGGKGANLGKLAQANLPVPPGFSVTTAAYSEFITINKLDKKIELLLASINYKDADQVDFVTTDIRRSIVEGRMPAALGAAIETAYGGLGRDSYVAVR